MSRLENLTAENSAVKGAITMGKFSMSEQVVEELSRPLAKIIIVFYKDPKNEEDFQRWLHQRKLAEDKEINT